MASAVQSNHVFINCPFDDGYAPIFNALIFVIFDLGFVARCARESDDSGEVRLSKIESIIEQCKFGIHDISEVKLDTVNQLPRFNMPLELGLFFGCKRFGGQKQKQKLSLILDIEPYRYQKFISDISATTSGRIGANRKMRLWLFETGWQRHPGAKAFQAETEW